MISLLDKCLLSENPVEYFYHGYNSIPEFRKWIDKTIPEVKLCELQQQNNPWHKYNVLGHILHSVKAINTLSKDFPKNHRRMLAYAMFFHDLGKPACHIVRQKQGKMIDSFFNHNIESARIAKEKLPLLGFSEGEVAIIEKLVFKHDIFMFIKPYPTTNKHWRVLSKKLILEEIKDLDEVGDGNQLLKFLVMIGRADNMAQNETMTDLSLLDKFDKMLEEFDSVRYEKERI